MRRLCTLFCAALVSVASQAAPPSDESIGALLSAMQAEKTVDAMLSNMEPMMRQTMQSVVKGQTLSAEQQRAIDTMPARFAQVMREEMSWDKMRPLYIDIYRDSFTQEEIDGLIAFYKSPTGVAYINKMPTVLQKSMATMQSRMGPLMEKMRATMQQITSDAKAAPK